MFKYFACFVAFSLVLLLGCGTGDVLTPGEEVVTEKWTDPVDIGKEYVVGEVKIGDTVTLSTGDQHAVGEHDFFAFENGTAILHKLTSKPDPHGSGGSLVEWIPEVIVPDGPPIATLLSFDYGRMDPVTKSRSVEDYVGFSFGVEIDRVLDYNLPVYLEYRTQDRVELGGAVRVTRFLVVVPKGKTLAEGDGYLDVGEREKHERACISILLHTEMQNIDLPATVGFPGESEDLPVEYRAIPEGHTFRPYRIRSSSFLMGETNIGRNW